MGQYNEKPKKVKKPRDPNRVYPNLFSHEKKLKESGMQVEDLHRTVARQQTAIDVLTRQIKAAGRAIDRVEAQVRKQHGK